MKRSEAIELERVGAWGFGLGAWGLGLGNLENKNCALLEKEVEEIWGKGGSLEKGFC